MHPFRRISRNPRSNIVRIGNREIITQGLNSGFGTDLYHRSMSVSWPVFFASAALIFIALNGIDPIAVYRVLYLGAFGTLFSLEATLTLAAPLMLTALCTAIPARAGLLVIGGEGALVIGGLAAVLAGVSAGGIPPYLGTVLVLLAGALAGGDDERRESG